VAAALLPAAAPPQTGDDEAVSRARIESALAAARPALVRLTVVSVQYRDGRAVRFPSSGSGVVVTDEGDLLTNFHVAGHSARIQATLADGRVVDADVVAHDPLTDLSVLRLRLAAGEPAVPPAQLAAGEPEVGEPVLALGSPLTLSSSVTSGIISNTRRVFTDFVGTRLEDLDLGGEPTGLFTQWIQHDALILPGNSGGPLVDLDGRVVGINELGGSGVGFAIPAAIAREVLRQALESGRVRRSDLGFGVLPVAKLGRERGALVSSIVPGGPADRSGLEPGDILLELAGKPVEVRFFEQVPELYRTIAALPIGAPVELAIERGDERRTLAATTVELDQALGEEAEIPELGVAVQEVTPQMARERQIEPRSGLLVTSLRPGLAAAEARPPVQPDDLLVSVGGAPVSTIAALERRLADAGGEIVLELRRDDEELLALAKLESSRSLRSGGELPKAWLGIQTQVVTPALAGALGDSGLHGFRVSEVLPWSAAEKAGLRVGDLIRGVDGEELESAREQDAENLRRAIEERTIGDAVALDVLRSGEPLRLELTLEARPRGSEEARTARAEELGFAVRDLTLFDRVEFHWERGQDGVLVTEVAQGGWAQMAGLDPNDLVLAVAGRPTGDVAAFGEAIAGVVRGRTAVIQIFVRRGPRTHFVFVEPAWRAAAKSGEE